MVLTARQLNRATLDRQLLLRREPLDVVDAVRRVVALQAQQPASPYLALWNRVAGFDPAELDVAFADHAIVKASLMRVTLHAVACADYPAFHRAMLGLLRAARLTDRRFTDTGLTTAEADALIPHLLEFAATPRTGDEVKSWLDGTLGELPDPGAWWALRTFSPVVHAPTGAGWSFGLRPSYVAAPAAPTDGDSRESVQKLLRAYLAGFGPATIRDFARYSRLGMSTVRPAFEAIRDTLVELEGPDGAELVDVAEATIPDAATPAPPRLMAMWDSVLLAYVDRSRILPEEYRRLVIQRNGDVLAALLVDGNVSGVWRQIDDTIEVTAFRPLPEDVWEELGAEAAALLEMLAGREPTGYSRYDRWWARFADGEIRILPG